MFPKPPTTSRWKWTGSYLVLAVVLHATLVVLVIETNIHTIRGQSFLSTIWVAYSILVCLIIAERAGGVILFIIAGEPFVPPKLNNLDTQSAVAILYCTCDDVVLECVETLGKQQYENLTIFILDDSSKSFFKNKVKECYERLVTSTSHKVIYVQRADEDKEKYRHKAGNLNNWLVKWGQQFKYFVVADADSILPYDFVHGMLLYAEHPANQSIAIFESKIQAWCPKNLLQSAQEIELRMESEYGVRISNRLGTTLSNGHNNLYRSQAIQSIGGFDRVVGEDHATTLTLIENGFSCYYVDIVSFEMPPASLHAYKRRTYRWVRNDLEIFSHSWSSTSLALQFKLILKMLVHVLWLPTVFITWFVLWSYRSSLEDLLNFLNFIFCEQGYKHPTLTPILVFFAIYFAYLFLLPIPQAIATRCNAIRYLQFILILSCLSFGKMFSVLRAFLSSLFRADFGFETTPKYHLSETPMDFFRSNFQLFAFVLLLLINLIRNPVALIFNWPWIFFLLSSPFVLYIAQRQRNKSDILFSDLSPQETFS